MILCLECKFLGMAEIVFIVISGVYSFNTLLLLFEASMFRYPGVGKSMFTLVHRENNTIISNTINLFHIFTTVNPLLLVPVFSGIAKTQTGLFFRSPVFFLWKPWRHPSSQAFLLFCPLESIILLFNSFAFLPSFPRTLFMWIYPKH